MAAELNYLILGLAGATVGYALLRASSLLRSWATTLDVVAAQQSELATQLAPSPVESWPDMVILLPVLREVRELPSLFAHMARMQYPCDKLTILVITTEREVHESPCASPSTIDLAEQLTWEYNRKLQTHLFVHIHYPGIAGNKASQLNFAVKHLMSGNSCTHADRVYVGVYDADSRPDTRTLQFVAWHSTTSRPRLREPAPAYQQVSLYTRNFASLPARFGSAILRAEALLQTRWALAYEFSTYARQHCLLTTANLPSWQRAMGRRLCYCIGHGCFFELRTLASLGGFPTTTATEDIALGNRLSLLSIPIIPVPYFDVCEVPDSLRILFAQQSVWFQSSLSIWKSVSTSAKSLSPEERLVAYWLGIQRTVMNACWAIGGIAHIVCVAYLVLFGGWALCLALVGILSGGLYTSAAAGEVLRAWPRIGALCDGPGEIRHTGSAALALVVAVALGKGVTNSVGPAICLVRAAKVAILGMPTVLPKTER